MKDFECNAVGEKDVCCQRKGKNLHLGLGLGVTGELQRKISGKKGRNFSQLPKEDLMFPLYYAVHLEGRSSRALLALQADLDGEGGGGSRNW